MDDLDNLKKQLDNWRDYLVEKYPESEEALDLYQAYIHYEFKKLNK